MARILRNPFFIYIFGFSMVFFVYGFEWSSIYPEIGIEMYIFFAITFLVFGIFGISIKYLKAIGETYSKTENKTIIRGVSVLFFFYALEFIIERDIPLVSSLLGKQGVNYKEFGIPLMHGILISFNSFIIAHSFATYLSRKNKLLLVVYFLLYIPALLFLSRSIIMLGLLTSLFIFLHHINRIKLKNLLKIFLAVILSLYFFGLLGNLRSGGDYIYTQSEATEKFMKSSIPREFYWTYLYVASPLANFQNTVDKKNVMEYSFSGFVFHETLPQIISKGIGEKLGIQHRDLVRIVPWLTVGTSYAESFAYIGWYGCYLLVFYHLIVYFLLIVVLVPKSSSYHITTIAIISVIVLLSIFGNILTVTGIFFQLAYCSIFAFLENRKIVYRL